MNSPRAAASMAVDLRPKLSPVGDQGERGTCVAFAVTAAHEHDRANRNNSGRNEPEDLSEETLYWGCKQIDGISWPGTRMSAADLTLQRWGQPIEMLWPYDCQRDDTASSYQPPVEAIEPENCHFTSLRTIDCNLDTIHTTLDSGIPVIVAMPIWPRFRSPDIEPLPAPHNAELLPTGHAVVIVGYDKQQSALLIRNSWGSGWNNDGHLWLDDAVIPLLLGAWVVDDTLKGSAITVASDLIIGNQDIST